MTSILLPRCRSEEDESNGTRGDKIIEELMVATEGRDFGVVDDGGS